MQKKSKYGIIILDRLGSFGAGGGRDEWTSNCKK